MFRSRRRRRRVPLVPMVNVPANYAADVDAEYTHTQNARRRGRVFTMGDGFTCKLVTLKCTFIRANGTQCQRRVSYGMPMCWQHMKSEYGVRIGRTELVDPQTHQRHDFTGLFAFGRSFRAGENIVPYVAHHMTANEELAAHNAVDSFYRRVTGNQNAQGFLMYAHGSGGQTVDAACVRSAAALANTGNLARANNASIQIYQGEPVVQARRLIRDGDEILVDYGSPAINRMARNMPAKFARTRPPITAEWQK